MNWDLTLFLHWPHDRFALGWEIFYPVEEMPYYTVRVFLGIATITVNYGLIDEED